MNTLPITFSQSCAASNAKRLAELIYSTDPSLQDFLFRATGEPLNAIAKMAAADKGFFSHNFAQSVFCLEELVGVCLCFAPDTYAALLEEGVRLVEKSYGKRIAVDVNTSLRLIVEITPHFPKSALYLQNLAVTPSHRNRKIGSQLYSRVLNEAAATGSQVCVLDVCSENEAAIAFYKSFNGQIDSEWSASSLGLRKYFRMHTPIPASAS